MNVTNNPAVTLVSLSSETRYVSGTSGDYCQTVDGKTGTPDLSQAVVVTPGLFYSF